MKRKQLTNNQMCKIVELGSENKSLKLTIKELSKYLARATNDLETMSLQYGDDGSNQLIKRIREVLDAENN